jgi:hypothetical protein
MAVGDVKGIQENLTGSYDEVLLGNIFAAVGDIPSVVGLLDETAHDLLDHGGLTGIPSISGLLDETAHDLLDHGGLTGIPSVAGLLDETAHDLLDHTGLTGVPSTSGLLDETAHDLLDHTGITGIPTEAGDVGAIPAVFGTENHTPSGFHDHSVTALGLSENHGAVNDTFRVTITGTNFPVYCDGTRYVKNTEYVTQVGALSKRYYIYYSAAGTLSIVDTPWNLESESYDGSAPVCTVLWDAINHQGILEDERHHSWRDIHWHHWAHHSVGARYSSAHNVNGLNVTYGGSSPNLTFSVSAGEIYDEDIRISIGTHTVCNLFYHHDANSMKWVADSTAPYLLSTGVPQYDTGSGIASKTGSNTQGYFVSWVFASNSYVAGPNANIAVVIGQDSDGNMTLSQARAIGFPTLPTEFIVEWKLLFKSIFLYNVSSAISHVESIDYRTSSSLPSGQVPTTTIGAASVVYAPGGNISATSVQGAIEELDSEKQAALTFGISDTNALAVNDASAADNDYAKFTSTGIEGVPYSTVKSDIGAIGALSEDTTPELGGELDCGAHTIGFTQQSTTGDGTTTIDWKLGNNFYFTFANSNETFTFTAPSKSCHLTLVLKQYSTGGQTVTWPGTIMWPASTAPTLSTGNNNIDIVSFYYDGTNYFGMASLLFGTP